MRAGADMSSVRRHRLWPTRRKCALLSLEVMRGYNGRRQLAPGGSQPAAVSAIWAFRHGCPPGRHGAGKVPQQT